MRELFHRIAFTGFGPNSLELWNRPAELFRISGARPATLRAQTRKECPRLPGVYGMLNAAQELVYVGKAKCLRSRLLSYFRAKSRDPKAGHILRQTRAIVWEHAPSEFAALLRELELIRRWRPRFNVQGQPGRRRPTYVCVGRMPAPYLFLARFPPKEISACFGPIPSSWRAREAVRRLNDLFQLRDCPQSQTLSFSEQPELFSVARAAGCLRYEIRTCLGPCVGACARRDYMSQVRAAGAFLRGNDATLFQKMELEMAAASEALAFERAAGLRDGLEILHWLQERLGRLRAARDKQSFVYPVKSHDGNDLWYLIHRGRVLVAFAAPQDEAARQAAKKTIRKIFDGKLPERDPLPSEELDGVLLVAAWFRRHPEERNRVLAPHDAWNFRSAESRSMAATPPPCRYA